MSRTEYKMWVRERAPATRDKRRVRRFLDELPAPMSGITVRQIGDWSQGRSVTATTLRRELNALSSFFQWCVRRGLVENNPVRGVVRPSAAYEPPAPLAVDEVVSVLSDAPSILRRAYLLAYFCGMRRSEICRAQWEDIGEQSVLVRGTKTRRSYRRVFAFPQFIEMLGPHVGPHGSIITLTAEQLTERCRPKRWPNLHRLRHSIATHLLEAGYRIEVVAAHLRDSVAMVETVYGHRVDALAYAGATGRTELKEYRLA